MLGGPAGEAGRLHRLPRRQPVHRRGDPDLPGRLRAGGLRHRGDHGRARRGPAGLGLRRGLRPADHPHRRAARGLRRQGVHRRRPGHQQPVAGRPGCGRGQGQGHRVAGGRGHRRGHGPVPPAGLAAVPPALLGLPDPGRLLPAAASCPCPTTSCRCWPPTTSSSAHGRVAAEVPRGLPEHDVPDLRRAGQARDRHHGHLRRLVLVLPALRRPPQRHGAVRPGGGPTGCRSTSTSAASSTPSCT